MTVTVTLDLPPDAEAESPDELVRRLRMLWALDEDLATFAESSRAARDRGGRRHAAAHLSRIGRLELLRALYQQIVVPETVWREAVIAR
jgi:hypothetical protein